MQTVSGIVVKEKKAPTEKDIAQRAQERSLQKSEAELELLIEKSKERLATIPHAEVLQRAERILPFVKRLAASDDGLEELAKVCAAFLLEPVGSPAPARSARGGETGLAKDRRDDGSALDADADPDSPAPATSAYSGDTAHDADRANQAPGAGAGPERRRRRGGSGRSGGGSGSTGGARSSGGDRGRSGSGGGSGSGAGGNGRRRPR